MMNCLTGILYFAAGIPVGAALLAGAAVWFCHVTDDLVDGVDK